MTRSQLFDQPDFVPPFDDLSGFAGSRIAITGGRGVLGGILARRGRAAGLEISLFDGDVVDARAVASWLHTASPTMVFHFAALVPIAEVERDAIRAYEVNALGAFHVAAAMALHVPHGWLFLASSSHVYAPTVPGAPTTVNEGATLEPATFYGISKLAGERLASPILERFGIPYCVGRIFSFTHHTQRPPYLVPSLLARIEGIPNGGVLHVAAPTAIRDILDAETVIDIVLALAQRRHLGTINIGAGRGLTVAEIARLLATRTGKQVHVEPEGNLPPNALVADVARLRSVLCGKRERP